MIYNILGSRNFFLRFIKAFITKCILLGKYFMQNIKYKMSVFQPWHVYSLLTFHVKSFFGITSKFTWNFLRTFHGISLKLCIKGYHEFYQEFQVSFLQLLNKLFENFLNVSGKLSGNFYYSSNHLFENFLCVFLNLHENCFLLRNL